MDFWWNYPFVKACRFFEGVDMQWDVRGCILRVGPIAFSVWWRAKKGGE